MALKFYCSMVKMLKLKVKKFLELICTFVKVTWKKMVEAFLPPLILNRVKIKQVT